MQQQDYEQFAVMMLGIAENYGQSVTPEGIALRFRMLAPYPIDEVQRAATSILRSRRYTSMPTVADFMEYLGGGSIEDRAMIEAGKVLRAIEQHGGYNSVVFDEPTTQAVIQYAFGGWVKLCADCGTDEPEKWFRHHFAKYWAAYKRQGLRLMGVLDGAHAIANRAGGNAEFSPRPRLVGDEAKAREVMRTVDTISHINAAFPQQLPGMEQRQ